MPKKPSLGKGFGSLLPEDFDKSILLDKKDRVQKINIEDIKADPNQPRQHFDEDRLAELSQSIKTHGILQPIVVTPNNGKYIIIAGERRFRAARIAGLTSLPALVRSGEQLDRLEISLVENVQRVDLSPLEQAISIAKLNQEFNLSHLEIGKKLGKAQTTIINIVRLIKLPPSAREALRQNKISEGHARTILSLTGAPDKQTQLLGSIIKNGWSVRQAEQFAASSKHKKSPDKKVPKTTNQADAVATLSKKLAAPVAINPGSKNIKISYKDETHLSKIIKILLA